MKKILLGLLFLLNTHYALAAPDFSLSVNNNTNSSFSVVLNAETHLDNLYPGEYHKVYELNYIEPEHKFALLFTSAENQKASVIYKDGVIFCNPQSFYYQCMLTDVTDHSATLTLSKD